MSKGRAFVLLAALACLLLEGASGAAWARSEGCGPAVSAEHGCCGAADEPARAPGCPGGACCRIAPALPVAAALEPPKVEAPALAVPPPQPELDAIPPAPPAPSASTASPPGGPPLFLKHLALLN